MFFFCFQKTDSDLTFEESFASAHSNDKISNQLNENSRTKLVSKRSVSDDSNKAKVDDKQSDDGWMSRVKRRLSSFFSKSEDDKVVQKRESVPKPAELKQKLADQTYAARRRRQDDDDDDDEDIEDNEIASGDHEVTPENDPITPNTPLPPVKDDKYCKIF